MSLGLTAASHLDHGICTDPSRVIKGMTTPTTAHPEPTDSPTVPAGPIRPRVRRSLVVLAAGGLLAGAVAVTGTITVDPVATADAFTERSIGLGRSDPWAQDRAPSGGSGAVSPAQTATVDSDPATATEEKGVAVIDTVLSNGEAAGTGIVLTSNGEVLTNYHVVEGSTSIRVTIATSGVTYAAAVVGASPSRDIALLQLRDASGLAIATIDDDTVSQGDDVTAVGNAGGAGELTAAEGEVTDLSTPLTTSGDGGEPGETLTGLIETDADVVSGDSGGPLVDDEGEVIGINTAASTGTEINGYAIPIDNALKVVTQIRSGDETRAVRIGPGAFLGVELLATAQTLGSDRGGAPASTGGATLGDVVDGDAADEAGLAAGDTITTLGSTTIGDADDLSAALAELEPGDRSKITWTDPYGDTESATVTLGRSPVN